MLLSTHFLEMRELLPQEPGGISLEQISDQSRAKPWRGAHKHMDMIFISFHRKQCQSLLLTTLNDEPFRLFLYLTCQHTTAVLRYPNQVIGNRIVGIPGSAHL